MALRSRRRYIVFTITYTLLMFWTCFSLQLLFNSLQMHSTITAAQWSSVLITLIASTFLSVLYAWIIVNYRRTEIATLKCIGYTNANVRTLIVGEIIWTTLSGFFLVLEFIIHMLAFQVLGNYLTPWMPGSPAEVTSLFTMSNLVITLGIFLGVQLIGILLAYRRVLKVRPMQALRIMK